MLDLDRLEALCEIARAPLTARTRRRVTLAKEASDVLDALPALIAELRRLRAELIVATNRIETQMHQLNDAQRESVSLELRHEDSDHDRRLLVQLWNAMVNTEQGWRILVDGDLLREFEQAVLNE